MALVYSELERIKGEISTNLDELTSVLNNFTNLIEENLNNPEVWYGTSSGDFKTKWDEFASTNFPQYKNMFNKEIENVVAANKNWGAAEGQ